MVLGCGCVDVVYGEVGSGIGGSNRYGRYGQWMGALQEKAQEGQVIGDMHESVEADTFR